jgi:adhesin/invasin
MNLFRSLVSRSIQTRILLRFTILCCVAFVSSGEAFAQATQIRIETKDDGSGVVVPAQDLASGDSIVVYAISRTADGTFVENVPAESWSLDTLSGGVVAGDLVPSVDNKSAVLKGRLVGSAYVRATFGLLTPVLSGKITIVSGPARYLVFMQQPTNTVAGVAITPPVTLQVRDSLGNSVPTPTPGLLVSMSMNSGTGVLSGTTSRRTDTTGIATFSNLSINLSGTKVLKATSLGLDSAISDPFSISPASAKKLVFVQQPTTDTAGTIITPPITVQIQDTFGNNVSTVASVAMSINSGTGTLSGTTTQTTNVLGLATFGNLSINLSGAKQLKAKSAGLDSALSAAFTINPAAATKLAIQTQPSATATAGLAFAQQPVIRIEDAFGNLVTSDNTTTITAARSSGIGTLQGTTSLAAVAGIVSFTNLRHNVSGSITIQFTSVPVRTPVTSSSIVINAAAASKLVLTQQPTNTVSGVSIAPPVTVQLQDTFSNNVLQAGRAILMALTSGTGTLSGTTTQNTNASGLATFGNLSINLVGTKTLTASSAGLVPAVSNSFEISVGPPASIVASSGTPQSAQVNSAFTTNLQSTVRDAAGNLISGATVAFTAPTTGPRGTFAGGLSTINVSTDTAGIARATLFTANTIAGSYSVTAAVGGVATPATFALTNSPGPARQIAATAGTPQSTQISTAFPISFQATVGDTFGNPLSGVTVTFNAPASGASGTFVGGVNTATTNSSGIATAAVFSANIRTGSYNVTATAAGVVSPAIFELTNLPGPANSITATGGTPQTAQVGMAFLTNFTAAVKDGANNAVPGVLVTFTKPTTGASGTFAGGVDTVRTDAAGIVTAPIFTANSIAGSYVVNAFAEGVGAPAPFELTNQSGPPGSITATAGTPQSATVNTNFATALQVLVRDASGNPVSNATVTFTAPSTGASGKFGLSRTATAPTNAAGIAIAPVFTADTLAGPYQVTASAPGVLTPAVFSLKNTPAPASRIVTTAGNPQIAQVGTVFTTNFKVRVTDSFDNPINGNLVTFSPPGSGASGTFSGNVNTATTDSTGIATAVPFSANFIAGSYNLPATATGVGSPALFALTNTSGIAASITATGGTPQSTTVNRPFAASLQATVRDNVGNPRADASVTFSAPVTGPSGKFSNGLTSFTAVTSTAGIATASFSANTLAGSYQVNANVSGVVAPAVFSLTNNPGAAVTVTASAGTPQSATVNRTYAINFQATVRDSFSNPVPNVLVGFAKPFSGAGGTFAGNVETATTNQSGVATAVAFTANSIAGAFVVNGLVNGVSTPATYSLTNLAGGADSIFVTAGTPQSTQVNRPFSVRLAVAVRDSFDNPIPNETVTFTVPLSGASGTFAGGVNIATTNSAGIATAPVLTANGAAGSYQVTASVQGVSLPARFFLTNTPGPADTIIATAGTPQSARVNTVFATNFRALVRDSAGNPVRGVIVTFTPPPPGGPSGGFTAGGPFFTDSNGVATGNPFAANSFAGSYVVNATVPGVTTPAQYSLTNTPGLSNSVVVSAGSGQSTTVGTVFPIPLQALVRDAWNNPVPGVLVTFTSPSTGASCNFSSSSIGTATTNASGVASIIAIANQVTGSYTVRATVTGVSGSADFLLTNTAAAPATITATRGSGQSAQVGTLFGTNLEATIRDAFGNLVPNALVRFVPPASGPSGTFQGSDTVRTDPNGVATARPFRANLIAGGPYNVIATVSGVASTASYSLTNLTGPPGSITILAGGTLQSARVGTSFSIRFKVLVKDSANNPVPNTTVTFSAALSGASGTFPGGSGFIGVPTDINGVAEAPVFTANRVAGNHAATAIAPNVSASVSFPLNNTPGVPKKLRAIAGTPQSAQIGTAFAVDFQAVVQDTFDNTIPNILVRFTAPLTGSSGTFQGGIDTVRTASNGVATARPFTANLIAGDYLVRATTAGVTDTALYFLRNTAGAPTSISTLLGSPQSAPVNTFFGGRLLAVVRDAAQNGVRDVLVRFSVPLTGPSGAFEGGVDTSRTDASGVATSARLKANTIAGRFTSSATTLGVSQAADFNLTNLSTSPSRITATAGTPQSAQVNTNFATRLQATVRDTFNNPVPNRRVVFFTPATGPSAAFEISNDAVTSDSGVATANALRANNIAGSYVVKARADGLTDSVTYSLSNTAGGPGTITPNSGTTPETTMVGTTFRIPLSVTVTDGFGNPLANIAVTFTAPTTGASGVFTGGVTTKMVQTNASGVANADTFRANQIAGTYSVTASAQGISSPAVFSMTNTVSSLAKFAVEAATGGTISTQLTMVPFDVSISARDAFSNIIPAFSGTVTITSSGRLFAGGGLTAPFVGGRLTRRIVMKRAGTGVTITATRTTGGTEAGSSNAFLVNNPVPSFVSITPGAGSLGQRTTLLIRGTNFIDSITTVNVGTGITIDSLVVDDTTQLRANIIITPSATLGSRNITIGNAAPGGGTSNALPFTVEIAIPEPPVLGGPVHGSTNIPTTVTFVWSSSPAAAAYHLQVGTDSLLTPPLEFDDSTLIDTSKTLSQLRGGTKFYWRVRTKNSRGFGEFSVMKSFSTIPVYPSAYTLSTTIAYPTRQTPGDYLVTDYRIVGLPGDGARAGVRIDQLLGGTQNTDWVVYRDNGSAQNFFELYNGSAAFGLSPGKAYWVLRRGSWNINSVSVPTVLIDTSTYTVTIPLQSGWNLITNPYNISIPWSEVRAMNGNLAEPIYGFNGTFPVSNTLVPYAGYYFFNSGNLPSLRIPFGTFTSALTKANEQLKADEWKVIIELAANGHKDQTTMFGVVRGAKRGFDSLEYHKPRSFSEIPAIFFNRTDWDNQYSGFATDFRPLFDGVEAWTFEVHAKSRNEMGLRFDGVDAVPSELLVYLIDEQRARYVDLRTESGYKFSLPTGSAEFKVVVGNESAVREILSTVLPKEFALGNNFPNPFNPTTSVPVALPRSADVSLKIYNILGEEVKTVFAGLLEAGRYFYTWDGRNNSGIPVATGIYFVRFSASKGPTFVKKMIMVK